MLQRTPTRLNQKYFDELTPIALLIERYHAAKEYETDLKTKLKKLIAARFDLLPLQEQLQWADHWVMEWLDQNKINSYSFLFNLNVFPEILWPEIAAKVAKKSHLEISKSCLHLAEKHPPTTQQIKSYIAKEFFRLSTNLARTQDYKELVDSVYNGYNRHGVWVRQCTSKLDAVRAQLILTGNSFTPDNASIEKFDAIEEVVLRSAHFSRELLSMCESKLSKIDIRKADRQIGKLATIWLTELNGDKVIAVEHKSKCIARLFALGSLYPKHAFRIFSDLNTYLGIEDQLETVNLYDDTTPPQPYSEQFILFLLKKFKNLKQLSWDKDTSENFSKAYLLQIVLLIAKTEEAKAFRTIIVTHLQATLQDLPEHPRRQNHSEKAETSQLDVFMTVLNTVENEIQYYPDLLAQLEIKLKDDIRLHGSDNHFYLLAKFGELVKAGRYFSNLLFSIYTHINRETSAYIHGREELMNGLLAQFDNPEAFETVEFKKNLECLVKQVASEKPSNSRMNILLNIYKHSPSAFTQCDKDIIFSKLSTNKHYSLPTFVRCYPEFFTSRQKATALRQDWSVNFALAVGSEEKPSANYIEKHISNPSSCETTDLIQQRKKFLTPDQESRLLGSLVRLLHAPCTYDQDNAERKIKCYLDTASLEETAQLEVRLRQSYQAKRWQNTEPSLTYTLLSTLLIVRRQHQQMLEVEQTITFHHNRAGRLSPS